MTQGRPGQPRLSLRFYHILGLSTLAVAHPLYSILAVEDHAPFLIAHKAGTIDLVLFVITFSIAIPAIVYLPCVVAQKCSARMGRRCHHGTVFLLILVFVLPLLTRGIGQNTMLSLMGMIAAAVSAAGVATYLYSRMSWARLFVSILSIGVVVAPVMFLSAAPVRPLLKPPSTRDLQGSTAGKPTPPVVMIVFDELPLFSLLDQDLHIDAQRYPNFHRLAGTSTWYRNTTSVHYSTASAIAALLTGEHYQIYLQNVHREPGATSGPIDATRLPHNLFSLLQDDYRIFAAELVTHLAPENVDDSAFLPPLDARLVSLATDGAVILLHYLVPARFRHRLPPIEGQWVGFAQLDSSATPTIDWPFEDSYKRLSVVRQFIDSLKRSDRPSFHFLHTLLPHFPYEYNERGQKHRSAVSLASMHFREAPGVNTWPDEEIANRAQQAHLLQLQFTDVLLGRIIDQLEGAELFEDSLIVVTSDHGTNFFWDEDGRSAEELSRIQSGGTLFVPLLIKWPHQDQGEIDDVPLQTIDLVPTIADYLERTVSWPHSGLSAFGPVPADRQRLSHLPTAYPFRFGLQDNLTALRRKFDLFGSGGTDKIYRYGPYPGLVGQTVDAFASVESGVGIELELQGWESRPDPGSARFPAYIRGSVDLSNARSNAATPALAIALDGVIKATVRSSAFDLTRIMPADRNADWQKHAAVYQGDAKSMRYFSACLRPADLANGLQNLSIHVIQIGDEGQPAALGETTITNLR